MGASHWASGAQTLKVLGCVKRYAYLGLPGALPSAREAQKKM